MNRTRVGIGASDTAVPGFADPASPMTRQLRVSRLLWAVVDGALIGALFFVLFMGFGLVGNRWYHIIGIQSGSMAPTFSPGDLVVVLPPPAKVETGMVLVMDVGNELVTHRVVSVNADGTFATRGDANTVNDAWGGMEIKVEGLYVATIPWLGNVVPVRAASAASFVDRATASMSITVGPWPPPPIPPTPPECADMKFSQVIVGTPGDDVIHAGNGGALVFGLGGNDTITGGNGKDCLVGGDGNDTLVGGTARTCCSAATATTRSTAAGCEIFSRAATARISSTAGPEPTPATARSKDTFVSCETSSTTLGTNPVAPLVAPTPGTQIVPPTSGASPTPDSGAAPSPDLGATPGSTPDPTAGASPSPDPGATPGSTPDPTSIPTDSPSPVPDATPLPEATASPAPTMSPQPTAAPPSADVTAAP